ncbi:hypothetical protein NHX12_014808 [Muraenolepis orangiensis]|uniref:Multidrug resistance-associated protein 4 n=1 Tax=Muraenolepis orangiensis TaxID=630683 RepID=A0A9Q0DCU2_9TELE|nr:hypothetical protein NHX12_014808 [Muraenolepis orangiensis]
MFDLTLFNRRWDEECLKASKKQRDPSFAKAIIRCYRKSYAWLSLITFIVEVTRIIQPVLLGKLLEYFEAYQYDDALDPKPAYLYATGISLSVLTAMVILHLFFFKLQSNGMRIRVALSHMIYKKALRLSSSATAQTTTGQIVNLLSTDVNKFDELPIFLHYLWAGPLNVVVVVALLWSVIGPSCLAGCVVLLFLMPLQSLSGKLFSKFSREMAVLTDSRILTMNEVVSGIRIIKMYAWEKPFAALVSTVRQEEVSKVMNGSYLRAFNMAFSFSASKLIVFITFSIYVTLGNIITASRVFYTVALYNSLRLTATLFFPTAIEKLFECRVSVQRIQTFLMLEDVKTQHAVLNKDQEPSVDIQDLICYWDTNQDMPSLQNISLTVKAQQLLAVIGTVGAGKSSLLSAILGELPHNGVLKVKGQLTYASQQPWVFPGTIRSNILFGKEMNPSKYDHVIRACALKRDMELLPDGDMTLIGDRGATLSGGQKARVNLARAVYQDADIYLLDDPLSAVDAENKPRILVTHQLQFLKVADQILVLKEGGYTELQESGLDFTSLLKKQEEDDQQAMAEVFARTRSLSSTSTPSLSDAADLLPAEAVQTAEAVHTMAEESRVEGTVGLSLYYKYLRAGAHVLILVVVVVLNIAAQGAYVLQDWTKQQAMLTDNSTSIQNDTTTPTADGELDLNFYLGVYGGLTAAVLTFGYMRSLLLFIVAAVLRTPLLFFDNNPVGRVLNRFAKDIGQMDSMLPKSIVDCIQVTMQVFGVIIVTAVVIPWILLLVFPLLLVFLFICRYFLQTSRSVKRLEATSRSPIFSHLSSTLQGLWTIRAFRAQERFQNLFEAHLDLHSECWFMYLATSRWFAMRLDAMCAIFISITTFSCVLLRDSLGAGEVGLALTYSITLMEMFQWGVRQSAEIETMMTSVERVVEYTELPSEAPWETQKRPPPDWPSQGLITFDGVDFSYSPDGPLVLRDMKATFLPREKVGIVGRTGAGKSSLVSALFRLAEPQGKIYVDGILTSEIGLHDLRRKMSIIPQDPVLFTGTMRKNLDPFSQHSEEELWNALQEVQLKSVVEELPGKMEMVLAESGANFSVGQRQLVCLARAILRKNRVLIIDEATANVDPRTDGLIQKTIRDKFRDCTVLTIAHRLNTIIDSDRILVLDAGEIHAYDEPHTLLQDPKGIFSKMVQQTGKQEAADLRASAKQAYENRTRPGNRHAHTNGGPANGGPANGGPANRGPANGNLVICQTAM